VSLQPPVVLPPCLRSPAHKCKDSARETRPSPAPRPLLFLAACKAVRQPWWIPRPSRPATAVSSLRVAFHHARRAPSQARRPPPGCTARRRARSMRRCRPHPQPIIPPPAVLIGTTRVSHGPGRGLARRARPPGGHRNAAAGSRKSPSTSCSRERGIEQRARGYRARDWHRSSRTV